MNAHDELGKHPHVTVRIELNPPCEPYLVAHPTNRKWVTTLVIDGISGGNVHLQRG